MTGAIAKQAAAAGFAGHHLRDNATGEVFVIERSSFLPISNGTTGAAVITRRGMPGYQVPFEAISLHVPEGRRGWTLLPLDHHAEVGKKAS